MARGTRRLIAGIAAAGVLGGLAILGVQARRLVPVGVAYKAKTLCSGVFVSRRDPKDVLAEIEVDDRALLRYVGASIQERERAVTASALGLVKREAIYRDGLGCTVVVDGMPRHPARDAAGSAASPRAAARDAFDASERFDWAPSALTRVLDAAFDEPNPQRLRRTRAVVIVHKGHIIAERYAPGIGRDTPLLGWSMTKSVVNALAGVLVRDGRLSLDLPAPVDEWQAPGDPRGRITLDHLLRMSSGLRFDDDPGSPAADVITMLYRAGDMASFAAGRPLQAAPGTTWHYSSGTTNIVARVIRTVLKDDREYLAFPRRALFDRIGMAGAVLEADASGTFVGSSYMYATAREWARFGMLYLQNGVWNGQRILPDGWVQYTRSPAPADPRKHYGAHFWLEVPDEYRTAGVRLPDDAFHAAGHEGQFVTVVPSQEAVIVRLGLARYPEAWDHAAFVRDVLAALQPSSG
jgi:CubicO group peptidase (beta-lactamase class C family)